MYKDYIKDMDEFSIKKLKSLEIEACEAANLGLKPPVNPEDVDEELLEALERLEKEEKTGAFETA